MVASPRPPSPLPHWLKQCQGQTCRSMISQSQTPRSGPSALLAGVWRARRPQQGVPFGCPAWSTDIKSAPRSSVPRGPLPGVPGSATYRTDPKAVFDERLWMRGIALRYLVAFLRTTNPKLTRPAAGQGNRLSRPVLNPSLRTDTGHGSRARASTQNVTDLFGQGEPYSGAAWMSDCSHSAANGVTRSTASEKETTLGQGGHRHRLPAVPTASF